MSAITERATARLVSRPLSVLHPERLERRIRTGRRVVPVAAAAAVAVMVAGGYVFYVAHFAINGVYADEWNWVGMINKSYAGTLTLQDLWQQHNENRMLFPNLIVLLLSRVTAFNDLVFIYLGAMLLMAAVVLLAVACRRELLKHPLAYLPAIFVFFSPAQYENSLWAFQLAWFMVVACVAGALALLTVRRVDAWRLTGAVAIGVLASFSSIEGLLVWAAGLVVLMRTDATTRLRGIWAAAGVLVTALYLYGLKMEQVGSFLTNIPAAIYGFFVVVGSVMPGLILPSRNGTDLSVTAAFGLIIAAAGCVVLAAWIRNGRRDRVLAVASGLVTVGLLFDLMLVPSRLSVDVMSGTVSRYTTFNLLLLAGAYVGAVRISILTLGSAHPRRIAVDSAFAGALLALLCIQVATSVRAGVLGGAATHAAHAEAANLTVNHSVAPRSLVAFYGYPPSYDYFETQAAFLEAEHLNVFGDGESAYYERVGILDGGVVTSPLPVPPELGPVQANISEWRAWLALSSVYEQRPDLQAAFPGPTQAASRRMVAWALQSGMDPSDPADSAVLQPYADQYRTWLAEEVR